jgi:hypothetical protein
MSLQVTPGERAAGAVGVVIAVLILAVCLDLALDGALFGWLPSSSAAESEGTHDASEG